LVLGAGVSMGFRLPNWDKLLQELIVNTIDEEQNTSMVLAKLFNNISVSYTHLRAHETVLDLVCRLLLEKKKKIKQNTKDYDTNF